MRGQSGSDSEHSAVFVRYRPINPNWRNCEMQTIRKFAATRPALAVTGFVIAALALGAPRKW